MNVEVWFLMLTEGAIFVFDGVYWLGWSRRMDNDASRWGVVVAEVYSGGGGNGRDDEFGTVTESVDSYVGFVLDVEYWS